MSDKKGIKGPSRDEIISVWDGGINLRVRIAGSGPDVVYFHPAGGLYWDEFLDRLAEDYTVYAPELPGTTPGDPYVIHKIDSYTDLLLMYEEMIGKLKLDNPVAIGQSMGGMFALDLAATFTSLFRQVVALAPTGLWREDAPIGIADLYASPPADVPAFVFHDPSLPAAQAMFRPPEDPAEIPVFVAGKVWALGCAGKFLWPIPDHGLEKRLYRISVPTLILWGQQDRVVPSVYAEEFGSRIKDSTVSVFEECGHILQIEKLPETLEQVRNFLA